MTLPYQDLIAGKRKKGAASFLLTLNLKHTFLPENYGLPPLFSCLSLLALFPGVSGASTCPPGWPLSPIPCNVSMLASSGRPLPRAPPQPVGTARRFLCYLAPTMNIFNFIIYLPPSLLNVMNTASTDSLLIFKSVFAILWAWDGTAQVHIEKTTYKMNIRRTILPPRGSEATRQRGRCTGLQGEGERGQFTWAWVGKSPHTTANPMSLAS